MVSLFFHVLAHRPERAVRIARLDGGEERLVLGEGLVGLAGDADDAPLALFDEAGDGLPKGEDDGVPRRLCELAVKGDSRADEHLRRGLAASHLPGQGAKRLDIRCTAPAGGVGGDLLLEALAHLPELEQGLLADIEQEREALAD